MDAAIYLIMDQFKELKSEISTKTGELKADMCALGTRQVSLKSDIGTVTEDKLGHCMGTITTRLKTEINYFLSAVSALESKINEGQTEVEGKWESQKNS
jgi:hypothetical protein